MYTSWSRRQRVGFICAAVCWLLAIILIGTEPALHMLEVGVFFGTVAATLTVLVTIDRRINTNERSFWLGLRARQEKQQK